MLISSHQDRTALVAYLGGQSLSAEIYGELGLTSFHLPPIAAAFHASVDTFVVEEIPLYEPQGQGEHLYLWVEKRGLSSGEMKQELMRILGIVSADVGIAGMKDKHATTRQWVSVPYRAAERLAQLAQHPALNVLRQERHLNKLRTGHLRANRFHMHLQALPAAADESLLAAYRQSLQAGILNFYGPQRFGDRSDTAVWGERLLRGEGGIPRRFLGNDGMRLALSAWQSRVFNAYAFARWAEASENRVLPGDVMMKGNGACFMATEVAEEQARCDAGETWITGPLPGDNRLVPGDVAAAKELAVIAQSGVSSEAIQTFRKHMPGSRRPLRVVPEGMMIEREGDALHVAFTLPAGSYATVLAAELAKKASQT